ncbi:MAG: phosphate ABC transporter permease subunit PstC [Gammaproteobacteria bacterium]|nr:phosphate ABC transporter permease subunit PstC [Gammaproteobacteria bacterium]
MSAIPLFAVLLALSGAAYMVGRQRACSVAGSPQGLRELHSRPTYYGSLAAMWCAAPAILLAGVWFSLEGYIISGMVAAELPQTMRSLSAGELGLVLDDIRGVVEGNATSRAVDPVLTAAAERYRGLMSGSHWLLTLLALGLAILTTVWVRARISTQLRARNQVEAGLRIFLIASSLVAVLTTVGIVLSVLFEAHRFFQAIPPADFLFGTKWSPQTAIREDQVGSSGAFGAVPLFVGTLLISGIAMCVAVPIGLMSAIYLAEYAHPEFRAWAKPMLEVLAGIPTVVYGYFAALVVAPEIRGVGEYLGLDVSSESALAAGTVMGIMIIPFVSSIADDVITAVPQSLRDGSYGLGATQSETIRQVVIPAALPGIVGGVLLAVSRAIGETMIVVMAAGLAANLTANPLEAVTTVTVQIVTLLTGDQVFDSPKTLAAFALGLILFIVTLILNVIALYVVRKYREQYE